MEFYEYGYGYRQEESSLGLQQSVGISDYKNKWSRSASNPRTGELELSPGAERRGWRMGRFRH